MYKTVYFIGVLTSRERTACPVVSKHLPENLFVICILLILTVKNSVA
jgi:hypothetical protein